MREEIFAVEFPKPIPVPTPEWPALDGKLFVRALSAAERDAYEASLSDGRLENWRAKLVVFAACDAEGRRIFEDGDVERVGRCPATLVARLFEAANRLSRTDALEDSVKN